MLEIIRKEGEKIVLKSKDGVLIGIIEFYIRMDDSNNRGFFEPVCVTRWAACEDLKILRSEIDGLNRRAKNRTGKNGKYRNKQKL